MALAYFGIPKPQEHKNGAPNEIVRCCSSDPEYDDNYEIQRP